MMKRAVRAAAVPVPSAQSAAVATAARRYATAVPHAVPLPGTKNERKKVSIFNRDVKLLQRNRFAKVAIEECKLHNYLADSMMERLSFVQRDFETVLEIGCGRGVLSEKYLKSNPKGLKTYMQCDMSQDMLDSCFDATCDAVPEGVSLEQHCVDEDAPLPFERRSVDLCITMLSIHWVNDIEATLKQLRTVLKKDGVLFICVFGGKTLAELQSCFTVAEQERDGGVSPHINPFLTGPSMGDLFSNSGYNFPTIDIDRFTFYWPTTFHLMEYLQMIGESNCLFGRRSFLSKDVLLAAAAIYDQLWKDEQGVPSTFEVIHAVGWSPHPSHAEPSPRGGGKGLSLKDIAETLGEEIHSEEEGAAGHELSLDQKRLKLLKIMQGKGMSQTHLKEMTEMMQRKIDGDDSEELAAAIEKSRKALQDSYTGEEVELIMQNLPGPSREQIMEKTFSTRDPVTKKQRTASGVRELAIRGREKTASLERGARLSHGSALKTDVLQAKPADAES